MTIHFLFLRLFSKNEIYELRLFDWIMIYVQAKLTLIYFQVRKNINFFERLTKVAKCRYLKQEICYLMFNFFEYCSQINSK